MINLFWKILIIFLLSWHNAYAGTQDLSTLKFYNPLMLSAQKGQISELLSLLQKGYSPDTKEHNMTPLFLASYNGHVDIVKNLIKAGANVNSVDSEGNNSLYFAYNNPEMVEILINSGINPWHNNKNHKNVVELAVRNNNINTLQAFAKYNIFDHLTASERTKLLGLSNSPVTKKIILSQLNTKLSQNNDSVHPPSVLAKEDLVELPSGSSIVIAHNTLKPLNNTTTTLKDQQPDIKVAKEQVTSKSLDDVKPIATQINDQQPDIKVAKEQVTSKSLDAAKPIATQINDQQPDIKVAKEQVTSKSLDAAKPIATQINDQQPDIKVAKEQVTSKSLDAAKPIATQINDQQPDIKVAKEQVTSKSLDAAKPIATMNHNILPKKYHNIEKSPSDHNLNKAIEKQKKIKKPYKLTYKDPVNTLWIEIGLTNLEEVSSVTHNILNNKILSYPIRIQTIRSLSDNGIITLRAGPFYSFEEASLLCKSINYKSRSCLISDGSIIQPIRNKAM